MSMIQDRIESAILTRWELGKTVTVIGPRGGRIVISKKGTIYRTVKSKHHAKQSLETDGQKDGHRTA